MQAPAWIDRTASDLLDLEAELRPLLRALRYHTDADALGPPPGRTRRAAYGPAVSLSANEARTLLRAAMPVPVTTTRLRAPHARMLAALHLYTGHLLTLADPLTDPRHAAAAALDLAAELRTWLAVVRWQAACRAAGVRWPLPAEPARSAIRQPTQHQTDPNREHPANTLTGRAEAHRTATEGAGAPLARAARRRAAALAQQEAQDLAAATPAAAVVPLPIARPPAAPIAATPRRRTA